MEGIISESVTVYTDTIHKVFNPYEWFFLRVKGIDHIEEFLDEARWVWSTEFDVINIHNPLWCETKIESFGFRCLNMFYIMKPPFEFNVRAVPSNHCHILQTHKHCLFYSTLVTDSPDEYRVCKYKLEPFSIYKIPSETMYTLSVVERDTMFAIDEMRNIYCRLLEGHYRLKFDKPTMDPPAARQEKWFSYKEPLNEIYDPQSWVSLSSIGMGDYMSNVDITWNLLKDQTEQDMRNFLEVSETFRPFLPYWKEARMEEFGVVMRNMFFIMDVPFAMEPKHVSHQECHIIQTYNQPVIYATVDKKSFQCKKFQLRPHSVYKVSPNTNYILSVKEKRTLFAVDVMHTSFATAALPRLYKLKYDNLNE